MSFYKLQEHQDKWYLLDPQQRPVFLRGANHYGDGTSMPVNLEQRYGSREVWRRSLRDRHIEWGFNYLPPSVGPSEVGCQVCPPQRNAQGGTHWPDAEIHRTPEWQAAHFAELEYPFTAFLEVPKQYMAGTGMPDVFSRAFREEVDRRCRAFVEPLKDNPHLIGYHFCHNPPWSASVPAFNQWIAEIVDDGREAKSEWARLMRRLYGSVGRWRATYGIPIQHLDEIADLSFPLRGYVSANNAQRDKLAFMQRVCREWYTVYSEAIRRYDSNHLIFGDRNTLHLQPLPEYAVHIMGQFIDVLSINVMGPPATVLGELEQITAYWDGPIHLADTGAGIYNGQYPKAAYQCADLDEYAALYRGYMQMGVEHPQLVGLGWCGYYETPSSRSGLVDSRDDEPLQERIDIIKEANAWQDKALAATYTSA